jgi:hypothetical protein
MAIIWLGIFAVASSWMALLWSLERLSICLVKTATASI